jgi:hypothetical protein
MIDNLQHIKELLNFEKPGDFYYCLILKRKKDQPEDERENHQSVRTIKSYCIESIEQLEKRYNEIKQLCEVFNARAYIHVQKQNHYDISLIMLSTLANRIQDGSHRQQGLFDSVVGKLKTHEKRWIVDIDTKDQDYINEVTTFINTQCRPIQEKVHKVIPTKSGYHLITSKFDMLKFKKKYPDIDLQKKNPTLLFLPNSLNNE